MSHSSSLALASRAYRQRVGALDNANEIRVRRAEFKRAVRDGTRRIEDAVREPEWWLLTLPVHELLRMMPRRGPVSVNRALRRADVWPLKELGRLTLAQRSRLVRELERGWAL